MEQEDEMSEWTGKIVTYDRCGREVRRKLLERTELDGGFTHTNRFVEMPETWKYHHETGWLCPDCEEEFQKRLGEFMWKTKRGGDKP